MKRILSLAIFATAAIIFSTFFALGANADVTSLYGDKDGYGQGIPFLDNIDYVTAGGTFTDHRGANDLANAPITDNWITGYPISWTHNYTLGQTPVSANLQIFTAGIADIGAVNLLVDNTLLANLNFPPGNTLTHILNFAVPLSAIDGSTTFTLNNGSQGDGYAIDFAELRIQTVPEPSALLLMTIGAIHLAGRRNARSHG